MEKFERKDFENITSLELHVKTNSPQTRIKEWNKETGIVKLDVKSLPENGKANLDIIKFFTKLTKKECKIISGATSKKKIIKFE